MEKFRALHLLKIDKNEIVRSGQLEVYLAKDAEQKMNDFNLVNIDLIKKNKELEQKLMECQSRLMAAEQQIINYQELMGEV